MKGSFIALAAFIGGCAAGRAFPGLIPAHSLSNILLHALMLQVGISIGCNGNLRQLIAQLQTGINRSSFFINTDLPASYNSVQMALGDAFSYAK